MSAGLAGSSVLFSDESIHSTRQTGMPFPSVAPAGDAARRAAQPTAVELSLQREILVLHLLKVDLRAHKKLIDPASWVRQRRGHGKVLVTHLHLLVVVLQVHHLDLQLLIPNLPKAEASQPTCA